MKRCAVFSCKGLGDGLIALVLANNLHVNGASVTIFHPFLRGMQRWFPHLPIRPFPCLEELVAFDAFFFIYEQSPWMLPLIAHCEKHYPRHTVVLNPIATRNKDYPYWEVGKFQGNRPFVDNILSFCRESLCLKLLTKSNGIRIPDDLGAVRHLKRVVLHPTSSRPGKNWPKEKFLALADELKKRGYDPAIILDAEEKKAWGEAPFVVPCFGDLEELASFVSASGFMIGNDSGIGHLASCLGLPTVTICRSGKVAQFWRPAWARGKVAAPSLWIPNLKGFRLRDRYWKKWVGVGRVLKQFTHLAEQF
jgi:heptosyltransferase III